MLLEWYGTILPAFAELERLSGLAASYLTVADVHISGAGCLTSSGARRLALLTWSTVNLTE